MNYSQSIQSQRLTLPVEHTVSKFSPAPNLRWKPEAFWETVCVCVCVSIYSYTWVCVRVWLHIADSVFFFCFQGRIITPLSLSSPPLPVPPSIPSPLSAPCLPLLSGFFFQGSAHRPPPPHLTSSHPSTPLLLPLGQLRSTSSALCRPGEEWGSGKRSEKRGFGEPRRDRQGRGTMAALSALLKTWVLLQTLCLTLAQVVSGQGRLKPALSGVHLG